MIFSAAFLRLASRLGINTEEYFEKRYLRYNKKKSVYLNYNTGRGRDPRAILKTYNDLETVPSTKTITEAKEFVNKLLKSSVKLKEHEKVRVLAQFVNDAAIYTPDKEKWGSNEYWSSPFDLWHELQETGSFKDDCDGWATLLWWFCTLAGITENRLFLWAGECCLKNGKCGYGHCTVLYDPLTHYGMYHVEGSLYPAENNSQWLSAKWRHGKSTRYKKTWFYLNSKRIYK